MNIRLLQPQDQPALEQFLLPRLASSMFLLANSRTAGLIDHGHRLHGTYIAAFDNDHIIGVVAHYWNKKLILQAPADLLPHLWPLALTHSGRPFQGIIGPQEQVVALLAHLPTPLPPRQLDEPEFLYQLELAHLQLPSSLTDSQPHGRRLHGRPATPADQALLARWRHDYYLEALGASSSPELRQQCYHEVGHHISTNTLWLVEANDQPVAMTGFNATTAEAVQVGGVWTPPAYRRQGYARAAVAASLRAAHAAGAYLAILFTGETNIPAQKAYTALGFRHTGDYHLLTFSDPIC